MKGLDKMKKILTLTLLIILFSTSPAQFFELIVHDTSSFIQPWQTVVLDGYIKNVSNDSLHINMIRLQNNMPSGSWFSSLCMGSFCAAPSTDTVSTLGIPPIIPPYPIPPGDSILMDVAISQTDSIVATATIYIKFATLDESQIEYQWFEVSSITSSVNNSENTPVNKFKLLNNYPNPFNNQTIISAQIDKASDVSLQIFDILGREVFSTNREISSAGKVTFKWNGLNKHGEELSSGIYFYRVTANSNGIDNQSQIKKLTLLR